MEAGVTAGPELLAAAEEYLAPLRRAGVDTLVLGCTHYPLLTGVISYVMGDDVTLVSSAEETAKDVYRALVSHDLLRTGRHAAPSTTSSPPATPPPFEVLARRFLGPEVLAVEHVDHVAAHYPTGSLARITPEMVAAARAGAGVRSPGSRRLPAQLGGPTRPEARMKLTIIGCTGSFPGPGRRRRAIW